MTLLRSSALHMGLAFLLMGGWALLANRGHPAPEMWRAGLVQGCLSALITLFLKRMVESLSRRLSGIAALILPPLLAVSASALILTSIHAAAATPEIARTIAVPLAVTLTYSTAYSAALWSRHD